MDFKVFFFLLVLQFGDSSRNIYYDKGYQKKFPYYDRRRLEPNFNFSERLPHIMGVQFLANDVVIRTFPTEVNLFHENTEYTKNMSLELESSCGTSKSAFDEKDVVMLTLIEKDIDNATSKIVKSIEVDPLSVDFYPHNLTMKEFKALVQNEQMDYSTRFCRYYCDNEQWVHSINVSDIYQKYAKDECALYVSNNCTFVEPDVDYPRVMAEMEKMIRTLKYLRLFDFVSKSCNLWQLQKWVVLEMDNTTASLFPNLTLNHHFIANLIDSKGKRAATQIIDEYRIIPINRIE
uniref:Vitellogenin domain-containing protein n=1 Tax=Tetranychus urticae TaxID=32264 RepID=T1JWW0_TETUR